jgi:hypothetical protein
MIRRGAAWAVVGSMGLASVGSAQVATAIVSPQVNRDRTITLRYLAPNARTITVAGDLDGRPHPMTRGADGVWTLTLGPFAPDTTPTRSTSTG